MCRPDHLMCADSVGRVGRTSIDIDHPLTFAGEPCAGEVQKYSAGRRISLVDYLNGYRHGSSREWYGGGPQGAGSYTRNGCVVGEVQAPVCQRRSWQPADQKFDWRLFVPVRNEAAEDG